MQQTPPQGTILSWYWRGPAHLLGHVHHSQYCPRLEKSCCWTGWSLTLQGEVISRDSAASAWLWCWMGRYTLELQLQAMAFGGFWWLWAKQSPFSASPPNTAITALDIRDHIEFQFLQRKTSILQEPG